MMKNDTDNGDAMAPIDGFVRRHLQEIRIISIWCPVLAFAVAISRSKYYLQRKSVRNILEASIKNHRIFHGRIVHIVEPTMQSNDPYTFHFYHLPLFRRVFFAHHDINEHDAILCRLAGLRVRHTEQARDALYNEVGIIQPKLSSSSSSFGHWVTVQAIERDNNDQVLAVLARKERKWWWRWLPRHSYKNDIGINLLKKGHASCTKHSSRDGISIERSILENMFPELWSRMVQAEKYGDKRNIILTATNIITRIWSLIRKKLL